MFCKKCGKEIQNGWTACPNCGEAVKSESSTQQMSMNAPVKKKKSIFKRWWFWVIIVIVCLPFMGAVGGSDDAAEETKSSTSTDKPKKTKENKETKTVESESEYSILEFYQAAEDNELVPYTLNDKANQFFKDHEDCFPTTNYDHIAGLVDTAIEYKHVEKSPEQYGDKLMELPELYVMSIGETDIGNGKKFTEIETTDINDNFYYILYNGTLENIFKEDIIKADLLPLGIGGYENVSGGTTTTLIGAGSYVTKIEVSDEY